MKNQALIDLLLVFCASFPLTMLGLFERTTQHCSEYNPRYDQALSNYFEARGFPSAWFIIDIGPCGKVVTFRDKIVVRNLLKSWGCIMLPVFLVYVVIVVVRHEVTNRRARSE